MLDKKWADETVGKVANHYFENTNDWMASSGLHGKLLAIIAEFFDDDVPHNKAVELDGAKSGGLSQQ